jgi:serine/threonine protein kinase
LDAGDETKKIPMPADTLEILTGGTRGGSTAGGTSAAGKTGGPNDSAGSGTSLDTIVGRLVVEQGLATNDDVEKARAHQLAGEDPNQQSLAEVLVGHGAITKAQLDRLRRQVEAERSGQQIPGFRVLGKLGAGAMAAVFKARQISLDRDVAIKVLPRKFNQNKEFIERFYAEGRAAAQMNHPNIVQAYDVGKAGEFHYFVMEYVDGGTVHDVIANDKRFLEKDALDIIINIADALQHAHEKGLIHRDVKPKNIMRTPSGVAKLADLGLARAIDDKEAALAEKGKAYGTPYYISPEQIRGEVNVGPQADIYSLGATLYHMVTGSVPFNGKSPKEVMEKHLTEELIAPDHVNPKLSAGISEVIEMMMAKSRKNRYRSCKDLLVDLRAVRKGDVPPNAHKDTLMDAVVQVAEAQSGAATDVSQLPLDQFTKRSVWSEPVVRFLASALVVLGILSVVLLVMLVTQM